MTVAIKTSFLDATNFRGSRVKAVTMHDGNKAGRSLTLNWDHALSSVDNHREAARQLAESLNWKGTWHMGDGGDFYVFVRVTHSDQSFDVA